MNDLIDNLIENKINEISEILIDTTNRLRLLLKKERNLMNNINTFDCNMIKEYFFNKGREQLDEIKEGIEELDEIKEKMEELMEELIISIKNEKKMEEMEMSIKRLRIKSNLNYKPKFFLIERIEKLENFIVKINENKYKCKCKCKCK